MRLVELLCALAVCAVVGLCCGCATVDDGDDTSPPGHTADDLPTWYKALPEADAEPSPGQLKMGQVMQDLRLSIHDEGQPDLPLLVGGLFVAIVVSMYALCRTISEWWRYSHVKRGQRERYGTGFNNTQNDQLVSKWQQRYSGDGRHVR